jgi:hypothetical protein
MRSWKIFNRSATASSGEADSTASGDGADSNTNTNNPGRLASLRSFATQQMGSDANLTVDTSSTGGTPR